MILYVQKSNDDYKNTAKEKGGEQQMKKERGITLIKLIIIAIIIIGVIIFIVANNQGNVMADIEWGYMPSPEYYELRVAVLDSQLYGSGTLSESSFEALGKDVKDAKGKWFKNSDANFRALILDGDTGEMTTLTDGEHVAIFLFTDGNDYVDYIFADEDFLETLGMSDYNLLGGYKITIK